MKSAKKILLLVLSLVLLVGIFAVAAFADDSATAIVVYPDGSTVEVAVGDKIAPKAFTTETRTENQQTGVDEGGNPVIETITVTKSLYYGAGNTLYTDDAVEGWIFTVEGATEPLSNLTVTADMAGKRIIASGVNQVYSTIEVTFPTGDYYKWLDGSSGFKIGGVQYYNTVWAKAGTSGTVTQYVDNSGTLGTKEITYDLTKRVAGSYKLYFYDVESLESYFSTSASIEIGGVLLNYQDLRQGSTAKHNVKLYVDHTVDYTPDYSGDRSMFCWEKNGYDRPSTSDRTNSGANTSGGSAVVNFDLNGHTFIDTVASSSATSDNGFINTRAMSLWIYSSQAGAHFFKENSTAAFNVNDDAALYLGASNTSGANADNIHFHVKRLFRRLNSGSGACIYGGHYYQSAATSSFLVPVSGRVGNIKNASFYVKGGIAVFGDNEALQTSDANRISRPSNRYHYAISNCKFYTDGASPLLKVTKTSGETATLKFENCEFYGVSTKNEDTNANEALRGTITLVSGNTESASPITYKKATYIGGAEAYYYVAIGTDEESIAKAKAFVEAFVEGYPGAKPGSYAYAVGDELYYVANPATEFEYDAALNAVQKETAEGVKVYFAYTADGTTVYYTNAETSGADLKATLQALSKTSGTEIKLYADITMEGSGVNGYSGGGSYKHYLDINGYKLTITGNSSANFGALDVCAPHFALYSSRKGGVIDASAASSFVHTNNTVYGNSEIYGNAYIGERAAGGKDYVGNLTVYCKMITHEMHGTSIRYYSTTFVQSDNSAAAHFFRLSRVDGGSHIKAVENCSFVVTKASTAFLHYANTNSGSERIFKDCSFICTDHGVAPLFASAITDLKTNPTFLRCNFYNVLPAKNLLGKTVDYTVTDGGTAYACSFGFSGMAPSQDIDFAEETAAYIVRGAAEKTIVANGVSYVLNAELSENKGVAVTFKDDQGVFGTENWIEDAEIACPADLIRFDVANACTWRNPSCEIQMGADGAVANVIWGLKDSFAFSYKSANGTVYLHVSECGNTPTEIGDKFYELFSVPATSYEIVLYTEMNLTKAMGFGPTVIYSQGGFNRDSYDSLVNGAITLDLNGQTLTIDASLVGINLSAANFAEKTPGVQNAYKPAVFALECAATRYFTLMSSKEGAQIINNSTASIFGVGEGDSGSYKIEDAEGNITIRTKGKLFAGIESYGNTILSINGGTYIYEGEGSIANISRTVVLKNATFICTQATASIFTADGYRINNLTATNCVFYSPTGAKLLAKGAGHSSAFASSNAANTSKFTFNNCEFVNVTLTEKLTVNYKVSNVPTDFHAYATYVSPVVSSEADLALGFNGADVSGLTKAYSNMTVNGETYKMMSYYADGFALVNWGFGLQEYWKLGEEATHGNVIVDGVFGYTFGSVSVIAEENTAVMKLAAVKPNTMRMNLTLQSKIGVNLLLSEALAGATVTLNGQTFYLTGEAEGGYYVLSTALAPNVADDDIEVTVSIGGRVHTLTTGIGSYAKVVLAETKDAEIMKAQSLTYAMVEYVRAAAGNTDFLAEVKAPETYTAQTLTGADSENEGTLLSSIAFRLGDTIAIAIQSAKDGENFVAEGKTVTLKLGNGRKVTATVENGKVLFENLYVNEFYGNLTITIETETYNYSLANYLKGIENEYPDEATAVKALYNYAYYADAYVKAQ